MIRTPQHNDATAPRLGLERLLFLTSDNVLFPRLDSSQTSNLDSLVSSSSPSLDDRPRVGTDWSPRRALPTRSSVSRPATTQPNTNQSSRGPLITDRPT